MRQSWTRFAAVAAAAVSGFAACSTPHGKIAASASAPRHGADDRGLPPGGSAEGRRGSIDDRPGLGTAWGEPVAAPIAFEPFVRSSAAPWAELVLHYNDRAGVRAHADYLDRRPAPLELAAGDGALSVALVDDDGRPLPGITAAGRALIVGDDGARYRIVVRNATAARFEIVASVDGLDVIDGQPADPDRRGYLVDPYGVLTIAGFRTSDDAVAAFRFGAVADSYAARTAGDRNVGVVGMAIFTEHGAPRGSDPATWTRSEIRRRDTADPFPLRDYAVPPR